jgi:hypothetical protein
MGEYVPQAGQGADGLPNGGVYNHINLHAFHYSNNNPVKYVDPDGRTPDRGGKQYGKNGTSTPMNQRVLHNNTPPSPTPSTQNNTPAASSSRASSSRQSGRISMQVAFGTYYGPCMFRALLGIAETRTGQTLNQDQLNSANERYYGGTSNSNDSSSWYVDSLTGVINIGMDELGSGEKARHTGSVTSPDNIAEGTHATLLGISTGRNSFHFGEGDAMGNLVYDPLGTNTFDGRTIDRIDTFQFYTPEN